MYNPKTIASYFIHFEKFGHPFGQPLLFQYYQEKDKALIYRWFICLFT